MQEHEVRQDPDRAVELIDDQYNRKAEIMRAIRQSGKTTLTTKKLIEMYEQAKAKGVE